MKKLILVLSLFLIVVSIVGIKPVQAANPVDLTNTNWSFSTKMSASVSRVGKVSGLAEMDLQIGADEFSVSIDLGEYYGSLALTGSYTANAKGMATITEQDIDEDMLNDMLEAIVAMVVMDSDEPLDYDIINFAKQKVKVTIKPKLLIDKKNNNQETIQLALSGTISASVTALVHEFDGDFEYTVKVSVSFKGTGMQNLFAIEETEWDIPSSFKLSGKIKDKGQFDVNLLLGAKEAEEEFAPFTMSDGEGEITGNYTINKGVVTFYPDLDSLNTYIEDILLMYVDMGQFDYIGLDITKFKCTAKIKTQKGITTISVSVSVSYSLWGLIDENWFDYKGSVTFKGTGDLVTGE